MSFPPEDLCFELPEIPSIDEVCLPGGVCLSYVWDGINKIPTASDISMDFFSQIGPAMAPLKPVFDILDTVMSIFNCVKAIPKSILTLNPQELIDCFPALAKAVDQILKLIPQLSLPKMIKALLHNIATLLRGIASDLKYIESQLQRIADNIDRAAQLGDHKMNGFLVCAQNDVNETALSTAEALKGIGTIILMVNIFMGLIGGQEVPCFGSLISDNIGEGFDVMVDILTGLAEVLDAMADAIPDPDLILTLALGNQQC
jgi:hypothetical protein